MKKMLAFWMVFMKEHKQLLQESQIKPQEPENLYPQVMVENETTQILVQYSRGRTVDLRRMQKCLYYVHGVKEEEVCVRLDTEARIVYRIRNCMGVVLEKGTWEDIPVADILVPTGGMVEFSK